MKKPLLILGIFLLIGYASAACDPTVGTCDEDCWNTYEYPDQADYDGWAWSEEYLQCYNSKNVENASGQYQNIIGITDNSSAYIYAVRLTAEPYDLQRISLSCPSFYTNLNVNVTYSDCTCAIMDGSIPCDEYDISMNYTDDFYAQDYTGPPITTTTTTSTTTTLAYTCDPDTSFGNPRECDDTCSGFFEGIPPSGQWISGGHYHPQGCLNVGLHTQLSFQVWGIEDGNPNYCDQLDPEWLDQCAGADIYDEELDALIYARVCPSYATYDAPVTQSDCLCYTNMTEEWTACNGGSWGAEYFTLSHPFFAGLEPETPEESEIQAMFNPLLSLLDSLPVIINRMGTIIILLAILAAAVIAILAIGSIVVAVSKLVKDIGKRLE